MHALRQRVARLLPTACGVVAAAGVAFVVDLDHQETPTNLADEPAYYRKDGAAAFKKAVLVDSDVVLVSYPKCGTSWAHAIVFSLLRMDEDGNVEPKGGAAIGDGNGAVGGAVGGVGAAGECGSSGQVYPDGIRATANDVDVVKSFGGWSFDDMLAQRQPRLFTSHSRAEALPASLGDKGRLIVFARDPKDALVSGYFFVETLDAKPISRLRAWHTNGMQGYFDAFTTDRAGATDAADAPDATYGDWWTWHRCAADRAAELRGRAHVCFFEAFVGDFDAEAHRLASFLKVPLTPTKLAALRRRVQIGGQSGATVQTERLGVVGDHRAHLTAAHWLKVDALFSKRVGEAPSLSP
eukprot:CAMPEP_0184089156 /NCGR_PEP_ID=MMETSP0974-20121125/6586_1 /TAXON_ID=483370 /ORGANISM="non described non described, Strain CCMP2097" /LENGTH=352 /DNA_ID=CAMNT_0026391873 /DNA_START=28 /DNA_END=1083 /DNA_ORIENTATION=+